MGSWGPLIVGASHPSVLKALHAQIEKGTSFGAPCEVENELAKEVIDRMPCVEIVRFVNSGTEACLSVARLMRAATGRDLLVKFSGCYHGHADTFLVNAGSGVLTLGLPNSPGVLESTASSTLSGAHTSGGRVGRQPMGAGELAAGSRSVSGAWRLEARDAWAIPWHASWQLG